MSNERRSMPRQRMQAFAAMETTDRHANNQAFSAVSDVSRSGIGLRTGQPPLKGQRVVLRLALGEHIHTITALATRVQKRDGYAYHVGLDWSKCSDAEIAFLDEFLAAGAGVDAGKSETVVLDGDSEPSDQSPGDSEQPPQRPDAV